MIPIKINTSIKYYYIKKKNLLLYKKWYGILRNAMGLFKDKTNYILMQTMNHWQKGRKQSLLATFCALCWYIYISTYVNQL